MGDMKKYIYGIINSNKELFFGNYLPEGVYTISYQDISAVISPSEIVDYTYMLKDALARQIIKHQKVIEEIMNHGHTIIPMKLGTYALDEDGISDILYKGYNLIKEIFRKISDRIEIDVVVTWSDFKSVLKEIGEEEEIKKFKQVLLSKKEGATVNDQMKVGVLVKKALDEKREKCANKIHRSLSMVAEALNPHELMNDEMVVNTAFLINKNHQKKIDKKVEELIGEFEEKLNFRRVGPLPPYSFYTLEVKELEFEEIDRAAKKLDLNDFTTKNEIRKAYRRSALSSHPDKNPDIPGIEREFDEVTKAYKVLLDYCQDGNCSFKEEDFKKNSLIVKVRE